jgi:2-polyprenyl-6-methoxyphenol hydroxylase-like FAD-dependent oxidoreductase
MNECKRDNSPGLTSNLVLILVQASSNAQEEVEVQAQLVIGADGNQSAVRQAILGVSRLGHVAGYSTLGMA